jgi:hypothetical protein
MKYAFAIMFVLLLAASVVASDHAPPANAELSKQAYQESNHRLNL